MFNKMKEQLGFSIDLFLNSYSFYNCVNLFFKLSWSISVKKFSKVKNFVQWNTFSKEAVSLIINYIILIA